MSFVLKLLLGCHSSEFVNNSSVVFVEIVCVRLQVDRLRMAPNFQHLQNRQFAGIFCVDQDSGVLEIELLAGDVSVLN